MGFERFQGNPQVVGALRRMLAAGRLPHSLILAGPAGVGKHMLASMVARALNCLDEEARASGDFCGLCRLCLRLAPAEVPENDSEFAPVLAQRPKLRAEERRERPLVYSSHPDVLVFLPDGPLRQISIDQVRLLKSQAQFVPAEARRRLFIVDEADRMDPAAANSMLKVLEEPPGTAVLILTATHYYELLPTIRSRGVAFHLGGVPVEQIERFLEGRAGIEEKDRSLAARLADGSPGRALSLDLERARKQARDLLAFLAAATDPARAGNLEDLLARTEALARDQEETLETLLEALYGLLQDLMHISLGRPVLRHVELEEPLRRLARRVDWRWMERAAARLDLLDSLLRRNINRQIALESLAASLKTG